MPIKKIEPVLVNIGALEAFVAGGGLPEGKYALEFEFMNYQAKKKDGSDAGPARLGVMVTAHSLTDTNADPRTQFYSAGTKAHESFAPNPDTGTSLVPIAGGVGASGLADKTNYYYLIKSFYDSGLPNGIFTNDIAVLNGIHCHMTNIPEPSERASFASSRTSEVADEPRKNNTISVCSEIIPGGEPWDGGGGIPVKGAKPAAKAAPAKTPVRAVGKAAPAPVAPAVEAGTISEEDLQIIASEAITGFLEKNETGGKKLVLQTSVFKAVEKSYDTDTASAVIEFIKDVDTLNALLGELGFKVQGINVVAA